MNAAQAYWLNRRRRTKPAAQVRSAALADVTDEINTFGKYVGKLVMDLDTLVTYAALGVAESDAWRPVGVFDDTGDVTPA